MLECGRALPPPLPVLSGVRGSWAQRSTNGSSAPALATGPREALATFQHGLSSSSTSNRTPPSCFPSGLEEHADEGKLRNEKTQIPRRRLHHHSCLSSPRAVPTAPTVRGVATPGGSAHRRVMLLPQDWHGHGEGQEAWQEQRHPSLCSPHAAPKNQLSFYPWALPIRFTKSGGQRDGATSLLSGWQRLKKIPVLWDALLGWGDEPWSRAEVPPSRRTLPRSPHSHGHSHCTGRHFLPPQPCCRHAADVGRIKLPHTPECKSPSKSM